MKNAQGVLQGSSASQYSSFLNVRLLLPAPCCGVLLLGSESHGRARVFLDLQLLTSLVFVPGASSVVTRCLVASLFNTSVCLALLRCDSVRHGARCVACKVGIRTSHMNSQRIYTPYPVIYLLAVACVCSAASCCIQLPLVWVLVSSCKLGCPVIFLRPCAAMRWALSYGP